MKLHIHRPIFAQEPWVLFLTFATFVGTGVGLGYTSSMVAIGQYFERRRPLAYGITLLGDAGSGMLLVPFFTYTLQ